MNQIIHRATREVLFTLEADCLEGADLSDKNLSGALLGRQNLRGLILRGAYAHNVFLRQSDLTGADLSRADLSLASLDVAILRGADMSGAVLSKAGMGWVIAQGAKMTRIDLTDADLAHANLANADLSCSTIGGADFTDADLSRAKLTGSTLTGAVLWGARVAGADLSRTDLSRTDVRGVDFSESDLSLARIADVTFDDRTQWPDCVSASLHGGFRIAPGSDLRHADLSGRRIERASLAGANLNRAQLAGAKLWKANLSGADLGYADLRGAGLSGADLTGANLFGADLSKALLVGVKLRGANLQGAHLAGAWVDDAEFQNAILLDADCCFIITRSLMWYPNPEAKRESNPEGARFEADSPSNPTWPEEELAFWKNRDPTGYPGVKQATVYLTGARYNRLTRWPDDLILDRPAPWKNRDASSKPGENQKGGRITPYGPSQRGKENRMDGLSDRILQQIELRPGATEDAIENLQKALAMKLPADYLAFLRMSNGATGIGPNLFIILEPAEEVPGNTIGYGTPEFAPGLVIIGSDGCGNLLGIDTRSGNPDSMEFIWVDPYSMDWDTISQDRESISRRAGSFSGLLEYLDSYYANLEAPEEYFPSSETPAPAELKVKAAPDEDRPVQPPMAPASWGNGRRKPSERYDG